MKRRHQAFLFFVHISIILAAVLSVSAQSPVFGPEIFTRVHSGPARFERIVNASVTDRPYVVRITNGGPKGPAVSNGIVRLNDTVVFSQKDFVTGGPVLQREVNLRTKNQLIVVIYGPANSSLSLTIVPAHEGGGTIGPGGGVITIDDPSSEIFGTTINVPPGSIPEDQTPEITVDYSDTLPAPLPKDAQRVSKVFDLEKSMPYNFTTPITVTIPLDVESIGSSEVPLIVYWSPAYMKYKAATVTSIDRINRKVTFRTAHFSFFVALTVPGISVIANQFGIDTGFRPDTDGFFHPNFGTYDSPGGSCLGMALYSAWYYSSKRSTDGTRLYSKYRDGDPGVWQDDTNARELISRTFLASSQNWARLWQLLDVALTPFDSALLMWTALYVTEEPQILVFNGNSSSGRPFGHAVTVYRWNAGSQRFEIYDNNFRGETVTLRWSALLGFSDYSKTQSYGSISNFAFEGFGTALEGSEFETFYQGAEYGWSDPRFKRISVVSPTADVNDLITAESSHNVEIQGVLSQGVQNANYLIPYLNGVKLPVVNISPSEEFSFTIPDLPLETNTLSLIATNDRNDTWNRFNAFAGFKQYSIRVQGINFFVNPSFELGNFTGWVHETHTWQNQTPGSSQPPKSAVVNSGFDPIDPNLTTTYLGTKAARVNNSDPSYHISTVRQTAEVPNIGNATVNFRWAAVLQDPQHSPGEQPYVDVLVKDETTGQVLYSRHFYSNDPSFSGWRSVQNGNWKSIDWQLISVQLQNAAGHRITLQVTAADCALGGHGGYAYVDENN